MSETCKFCGALIEEGAQICTNCGKVIPKKRGVIRKKRESQFSAINSSVYKNNPVQTDDRHRFEPTMASSNQVYSKERKRVSRNTFERNRRAQKTENLMQRDFANNNFDAQASGLRPLEVETSSGNAGKSKLHPILNKIGWCIVLVVFLYFAYGGIRILITKNATYSFNLEGTKPLVAEDYGDAMYNYFESGWWHYRFTKGVYYTGETKNGDKFELYFDKRDGKTVVIKLVHNGETYQGEKLMSTWIMGMFMADIRP